MNVALVYFTYEADAELLGLSLQAVDRLRAAGDNVSVYVFDDASAPLAEVPEGVVYEQTSFERKGNLNGLACVDGMLELYERVFAETGADWLVKQDCDTFMNDLDWLRGLDKGSVGQVGSKHVHDFCSGACYAVSRAGVEALRGALADEVMRKRAGIAYCEDRIMGRVMETTGLRVVWCGDVYNVPRGGVLYHDWMNEGEAGMELLAVPFAVDFKRCRWNSVPENYEADREFALARMREYVEFWKQGKEIDPEQEDLLLNQTTENGQ